MRAWMMGLALSTAAGAGVSGTAMAADAPQAASRPAASRPAASGDLTLDRVFGSPDLSGSQPRGVRLSPDGSLMTFLRPRTDEKERLDLWARDTRTGQERMLVDSKKVGSGAELSEAEKMQRERARIGGSKGIVAYDWAPDGKTILVPLDGDLYLATLDGKARRLTNTPGGELNPVVSPRGSYVSFVRDQNLFVQPLGQPGDARSVTQGGQGTVHFGEAEFVAQEEMDRHTGYWWSPDERYVAVERFDEAPVKVLTRASIGAAGTKTYEQRYPAAGTPNVLVDLYVMRPDGTGQVKVDLGSDPDIYLARVDWLPDGSALIVQRQTRDQKRVDVLRVDPATGKSSTLFSEKSGDRSWVNLSSDYHWMKDGSLIWTSERDGYNHIYHWRQGKWTQLTKGPWVVLGINAVDEARGKIYFQGTKDDVLENHLYAMDLKGGTPTLLTERGWTNGATADKTASRFIISRSSPTQPTQVYLADNTGKRLEWINENRVAAGHPYFPYLQSHQPTKFGTLKAADGSTLYWEMITPRLEPGRKYPVFFEHYGGPGTGQQVTRGWQGALPQFLVDQGWIYFKIDNRGSYNRGKAFEDQIYHAMGTVEVADQLAGANYLKSLPYVDASKVATYGWSYGGYMSIKMLEKNPGVYAAAVSGAPVTEWQLYDTHYTERYLGDPGKDPKSYATSNGIADASKIRDPLLLIHGMADDNVFLDNSTAFAAEMQKTATPFEMMFYPGYTHRVGGPGVSQHLWGTILRFLDREVKNKPAAAAAADAK